MAAMHLVLPFAGALSPAATQAVATLSLPTLERLLARLTPTDRDEGDEFALAMPHERVLAQARGWPAAANAPLPFAASAAQVDGLAVAGIAAGTGWGLLSPTHWHLGTEQVSLTDPAQLQLAEADSRALFDAVRGLFDDDGWALHWGAATRWYATHASLATLPTASLDRVVGRNVDLWLNSHPDARRVRRLQAEVQMLLHTHPVNADREERGLLPVNSFWLSGTGAPAAGDVPAGWSVDDRLRAPALAEDWAAWADAWHALDAGPLAALAAALQTDTPVALTLCGERHAQRFEPRPRPALQRWFGARRVPAAGVLEAL
jgi:hypothetical protein